MIVMKFGGTSVGSAGSIRTAAEIVGSALKKKPIVVVSAVAKITDALIQLGKDSVQGKGKEGISHILAVHDKIIRELKLDPNLLEKEFDELKALVLQTSKKRKLDKKTLDHFQSFGERMSAKIVASHLSKIGLKAKSFAAWEIGMITTAEFGNAEPLESSYAKINREIASLPIVPVITGFIGKSGKGEITTLGRGGSDYTAAIIGAAIGAEAIEIWKDVDGIMTTDPRLVPKARLVFELAFEEACELAYFGAKVIHPKAILPAMRRNIPVRVLNTFKPEGKGTTIVASFDERKQKSETIEAFTHKKNITAIHIKSPEFFDGNGLMARIFELFEKYGTSIDIVSTSVVSVSLTIAKDEHLGEIIPELRKMGEVEVVKNKAVVCAVGGRVNAAGVAGRMFTILGQNKIPVEMISQAASGISITFVVDDADAQKAIKVLHREYIR